MCNFEFPCSKSENICEGNCMKYHDVTDDIVLMKIRLYREKTWNKLINKYEENREAWTIEEIRDVLHEIQKFSHLDFPDQKIINTEQVRKALDYMSRISIFFLLNLLNNNFNENSRSYATEKLYKILKCLEPKIN